MIKSEFAASNIDVIDVTIERIRAARRAKHDVETRIIGKSEYVGDEALQLGYEYTLRWLEIIFLLKDTSDELMRDKLESEPNPIMPDSKRLLESALFGCQQGEFTQLKRVLREHGDYLIKEFSSSLHNREFGQMQVCVGRHLHKLAEAMRSRDNPIYPLIPAWMDPRFNGEDDRSRTDAE